MHVISFDGHSDPRRFFIHGWDLGLSANMHCAKAPPPKEGSVCWWVTLQFARIVSYSKFLCCVQDIREIFLFCGLQPYTAFCCSRFRRWQMKKQKGNASIHFAANIVIYQHTIMEFIIINAFYFLKVHIYLSAHHIHVYSEMLWFKVTVAQLEVLTLRSGRCNSSQCEPSQLQTIWSQD